jgi:hypothetical protein
MGMDLLRRRRQIPALLLDIVVAAIQPRIQPKIPDCDTTKYDGRGIDDKDDGDAIHKQKSTKRNDMIVLSKYHSPIVVTFLFIFLNDVQWLTRL